MSPMPAPRKHRDRTPPSIIAPDLPPLRSTQTITASDLRCDFAMENIILEKTDLHAKQHPGLKLQGARFLHVRASGSNLDNPRMLDSLHDSCDWANASWNHAHIARCEMKGCRMTGFTAADSKFENIRFSECKLDLTVFHRTQFASCCFEDCVLQDSSFEEASLKDVVFRNCDLRR